MEGILFKVSNSEAHCVICWTDNRESAKRMAHDYLGGNPDNYTVTPLTERGETVHFRATLYV